MAVVRPTGTPEEKLSLEDIDALRGEVLKVLEGPGTANLWKKLEKGTRFRVNKELPPSMFLKVAESLGSVGRDFYLTLVGPSRYDKTKYLERFPNAESPNGRSFTIFVESQNANGRGNYSTEFSNRYIVTCEAPTEEEWKDLVAGIAVVFDLDNLGEDMWDSSRAAGEFPDAAYRNNYSNIQYRLCPKKNTESALGDSGTNVVPEALAEVGTVREDIGDAVGQASDVA